MPTDVLAVLSAHGFHPTPKRAPSWRLAEGAGTIKGLDSFGTCHALATDGVHMIVLHANGTDALEVHSTNWLPHKPDNTQQKAEKTKPSASTADKSAAALTRLLHDLSL